jgi:Pyridine nucleotide-disulphide oxidoreductase, dimerisation domain
VREMLPSAEPRVSPSWPRPRPTRAYPESNGFLTPLSDGERLTGAYALGPEAGEWLQQATLAVRAGVPLDVLRDTIQPFPTFSEIYVAALKALRAEIGTEHEHMAALAIHLMTNTALTGATFDIDGGPQLVS